ncbi:MAG: hypothetical protein ACK55Z_06215 [bacterium]
MGWGEGCIEDVLQLQLSILSQVGVYFLGRGTNRRLWADSSQRPLLWEKMFLGKYFCSTQPSPPNLENGTYVRLEQQIGETYTNHRATAANW